jgi:hypothetical protein
MDYEVIDAKEWQENGEGMYPSRVVLLKIKKGDMTEWSTHMQFDGAQDNRPKHIAWGHYFTNVWDAAQDFKKRN